MKAKIRWTYKFSKHEDGTFRVEQSCRKGLDARDMAPEIIEAMRIAIKKYESEAKR